MTVEKPVVKSITESSKSSKLTCICQNILSCARGCDYDENMIFGLHLAIEEAFANAIKHGNKGDSSKKVTVEYYVGCDKVDITISDEGSGFMPDFVPDPRCGENVYKAGGRGLLLMRAYMDDVKYNSAGNSVHMIKYRKKTSAK